MRALKNGRSVVRLRLNHSPEGLATTTPATILAAGSVAAGRLDSEDHLILGGRFEGQLRCARSVRVLAGAHIEGDIHAAEIFVEGKVIGNLLGRARIEILTGGDVHGDVCAPKIIVQEGVSLNGQVRMLGPDHHLKDYLLPVLLHGAEEVAPEGSASQRTLEGLLRTTADFLEQVGFEMELRPQATPTMRPIFRSHQPMSYAQFCARMGEIEKALQEVSGDRGTRVQATTPAQDLLHAMHQVKNCIVVLGPVVLQRQQAKDGNADAGPEICLRPGSLPSQSPEASLKPGDLLLELQKIHQEVLAAATGTAQVSESR